LISDLIGLLYRLQQILWDFWYIWHDGGYNSANIWSQLSHGCVYINKYSTRLAHLKVGQCNTDFGKAFKVKSYTSNKPKISVHTISIYVHDAIKPNDSFVEHIVLVFYMVVLIICSATYVAEKPIKIGQLLPKI